MLVLSFHDDRENRGTSSRRVLSYLRTRFEMPRHCPSLLVIRRNKTKARWNNIPTHSELPGFSIFSEHITLVSCTRCPNILLSGDTRYVELFSLYPRKSSKLHPSEISQAIVLRKLHLDYTLVSLIAPRYPQV